MEEAFRAEYGPCIPAWADGLDIPGLDQLTARYQSWEWNYGQSRRIGVERRFPWGGIELFAHIEKGVVRRVQAYTDAMDETLGPRLAQALESCPFQPEPLAQRLHAWICRNWPNGWLKFFPDSPVAIRPICSGIAPQALPAMPRPHRRRGFAAPRRFPAPPSRLAAGQKTIGSGAARRGNDVGSRRVGAPAPLAFFM